jgi:polar amino acid transport system ATP-binding protein
MTIAVKGLTKEYDGRTILSDLSVTFRSGEVTAILGSSGGGKSTLLRCIQGLETFDRGSIEVFGSVLDARPSKPSLDAVRRKLGFVFQQWNLFAHRTAPGNIVEAPIHVRKIAPDVAERRARELLEQVGLSHRAGAYPHELSGGEQQRVAIARALAMDPEAILLDEPTSALDPERRGEVTEVLRALARGGMTMLIVTHEVSFARDVGSRVVVMHGGSIVEDGPAAEVLTSPRDPRTRNLLGALAR